MTSLFVLALACHASASPTSILDHLSPRQEQNPTYTPSPTSVSTSTPNSSSSTSTSSSPPLSHGALAGIIIGLVLGTAIFIYLVKANIICVSRPYKPTDDDLARVWRQYGRGKLLYWTHGIDAVGPDEQIIWSTENPGSMVPLQPGQWIGGIRGTKEQEIALYRRYRNVGEDNNAGGGG